ncbi:hypothetical protein RclHR1_01390007 [Rhizophagus clarus]|uniref:F-box domain-containing protein n=1 Tax=Rhizophagus clarus TaxID=94130 RepID=A0A2Z6QB65_9GLOM|nr:hypothetical protein RclHR1_01390007 [Rhizophagus clarus]GET04887.1 hypothetical protein GLOIN_2v1764020 [Rhizophagus clarus]
MTKLNKDILFYIFEELQNDSKSLFSCLMVNRLWCETTIPILWKNPWCYDINYNNKYYLFIIIASYLSDDIKEFLMRQGIQLPSFSYQSLLFDYLSYCRSINVKIINILTSIRTPLVYNQFLLQQEFYSLFMKRLPELKYLDMKSIKHQIFYFPGARFLFESLCELKCDTLIDSSYFYGLARLCQNIERLIIDNVEQKVYNSVAKLIEVQKNLKYFEWKDDINFFIPGTDLYPYKEILLALEQKADTINHLIFILHYIDCTLQKVLPKLHKLKTLITQFDHFSEELLKMCVFSDLEIFRAGYYNLKAASIIIENSGGHLRNILLGPYYPDDIIDNFDNDSLIFIRKVHENCPSIETLSLAFSPSREHFTEFEKLLKICKNLKSLSIAICMDVIGTEGKLLENGEELLKSLIGSSPTNLREIRFLHDYKFSLEALEEFMGKWKGCALSILTGQSVYKEENYVKLINKYKNNGVIKDFRCENFMNIEDMDFNI